MTETRSVVVLGTSHRVQGSPSYPKLNDPGYSDCIQRLIAQTSVDFIFEEASGRGRTTAAQVADSLERIGYLDIDPSPESAYQFGIVDASGQPFPEVLSAEQNVEEDVQREELWCKRITAQEFKNGLVICGYLHTLSVTFRLRSAGFRVRFEQYVPHDVLCTHDKLL